MLTTMETLMTNLRSEMEKFERGNNSAGTRARKILQDIKAESKNLRDAIQEKKASEDTKA